MDARTRAVTSIEQAREDLDRALAELDRIPAFDPHIVGSVAHTLNNYISVMSATTAMLMRTLHHHPEPEVATWLDGIDHATVLMQHTVGRLLHVSAPPDFPLKLEFVNVALLLERAVQYYRPTAEMKRIGMAIRTIGEVPPAWADRVAVAVIVDNLLAYVIGRSKRGGAIRIEIVADADQVMCILRFGGGLTMAEQEHAFQAPTPGRSQPGMGEHDDVGLGVAWEFADLMGGSIWYESTGDDPDNRLLFRLPASS